MAKYEDYLPKPDGLDGEIKDAGTQQAVRQDDGTTTIDWETRYGELEKLNSRQAQTLGDQRKMIDQFITNPTPETSVAAEESAPITVDDLYADPDEAVRRAVESHPAIQEARDATANMKQRELSDQMDAFNTRHPDFGDIKTTPEFSNWVADNPTRGDLYSRGNAYDLSAADALISLYKAEKGIAQVQAAETSRVAIEAATLEDSTAEVVAAAPAFSRQEFVAKKTRAAQGDLEAEAWINANVANYRAALVNGQVRD